MIVYRWQAPVIPSPEQMKLIFHAEGLAPNEEVLPAGKKVVDHRHPLDEVRMIVSGELLMNISGNQVLLRSGDKVLIPSNTRHDMTAYGENDCLCLCAMKPFVGA